MPRSLLHRASSGPINLLNKAIRAFSKPEPAVAIPVPEELKYDKPKEPGDLAYIPSADVVNKVGNLLTEEEFHWFLSGDMLLIHYKVPVIVSVRNTSLNDLTFIDLPLGY
jgi:hypothetical protein